MNTALHWLDFDESETDDGLGVFEAMAAVLPFQAPQVQAEIDCVLNWARSEFSAHQGPVEQGGQWDFDVQIHQEQDREPRIFFGLTLCGSAVFCQAFRAQFL